jgi:hypothetical protein
MPTTAASKVYTDYAGANAVHKGVDRGFGKGLATVLAGSYVEGVMQGAQDVISHYIHEALTHRHGKQPIQLPTPKAIPLKFQDPNDPNNLDNPFVIRAPNPNPTVVRRSAADAGAAPDHASASANGHTTLRTLALPTMRARSAPHATGPAKPGPTITSLTGEVAVSHHGWAPALKMRLPFGHPAKKPLPISSKGWSPRRVHEHMPQYFGNRGRFTGAVRDTGYRVMWPAGTEPASYTWPETFHTYPPPGKYAPGAGSGVKPGPGPKRWGFPWGSDNDFTFR